MDICQKELITDRELAQKERGLRDIQRDIQAEGERLREIHTYKMGEKDTDCERQTNRYRHRETMREREREIKKDSARKNTENAIPLLISQQTSYPT